MQTIGTRTARKGGRYECDERFSLRRCRAREPGVTFKPKFKVARLPDTNHRDANGAEGGRYECNTKEGFFGREDAGLKNPALRSNLNSKAATNATRKRDFRREDAGLPFVPQGKKNPALRLNLDSKARPSQIEGRAPETQFGMSRFLETLVEFAG
jgi:hypothetical protein